MHSRWLSRLCVCGAALGACNNVSTTPVYDGAPPDVLMTFDAAPPDVDVITDVPADPAQAFCAVYVRNVTQCDGRTCAAQDAGSQCYYLSSRLNPQYISGFTACGSATVTCEPDGGADVDAGPSPFQLCTDDVLASLVPTSAQRAALATICNACPSASGNSVATPTECIASAFAQTDAGQGSSTLGATLLFVNDVTAQAFAAACVIPPVAGVDGGIGGVSACAFSSAACAAVLMSNVGTACEHPEGGQ